MLLAMKTPAECHWCVSICLLSHLGSRLLLVKLSLVQSFFRSKFCLSPSMGRFKLITKENWPR